MDYFDYDFNDEDYDSEEVFLGTQEIESFNSFAHRHNTYLEKLYTNMQVTYETFLLVFNKKYKKILEFPNCYDLACRLGYGMLMRHILETVSAYLVYESDILLSDDATVFDRLTSLFEKNAPGYDINTHRVLMHTLDLTNEIAHPHIISDSPTSLDEIKEFYFTQFKPLIIRHVLEKPLVRYARRDKKMTDKYMSKLIDCLDNFDISNKVTSVLIKGCLVRHLTECAVNYHSFTNSILPTDASTKENQVSIGKNLTLLSSLVKNRLTQPGIGKSISQYNITHLFELKNFSNNLMHENAFSTRIFSSLNSDLKELYFIVTEECSPCIINRRYKPQYPVYAPSLITTLLCGFLGWFGAHHFYCGNYVRGSFIGVFNVFLFLAAFHLLDPLRSFHIRSVFSSWVFIACLFIAFIAPIFSQNSLSRGEFESARWGKLPKTTASGILSIIFLVLQIVATIYIFKFIF